MKCVYYSLQFFYAFIQHCLIICTRYYLFITNRVQVCTQLPYIRLQKKKKEKLWDHWYTHTHNTIYRWLSLNVVFTVKDNKHWIFIIFYNAIRTQFSITMFMSLCCFSILPSWKILCQNVSFHLVCLLTMYVS